MGVEARHPIYLSRQWDWEEARDAFEGERVIKEKGFRYLPPTVSMQLDGMTCCAVPLPNGADIPEASEGWVAYWMYRFRAQYPESFNVCIRHNLGLLWQHPPTVKLPKQMEYLVDTATKDKKHTLNHVLRRMHKEVMTTGHVSLLADMPGETRDPNPFYLCLYKAEDKTNWNVDADTKGVDMVVFRECYDKLNDKFERETIERYRLFHMKAGAAQVGVYERSGDFSTVGSVTIVGNQVTPGIQSEGGAQFEQISTTVLDFRGTVLDELPIVSTNASELGIDPDVPPLLGLVRLCLAYYRNSADYEQNLYMSGQDTFVVTGENVNPAPGDKKNKRIGAGSKVSLPLGAEAKFVGVSGVGLPEQRKALERLEQKAEASSGSLTNAGAGTRESGEALATKVGAKTATLHEIASNCAEALQTLLCMIARWMGLDPTEVEVIPNKDFTDAQVDAGVILALWAMKKEGGPLTNEDFHNYLVQRGFTDTAFDKVKAILEEDKKAIEDAAVTPPEKPLPAGGAAAARGAGANTRSKGSKPKKAKPST